MEPDAGSASRAAPPRSAIPGGVYAFVTGVLVIGLVSGAVTVASAWHHGLGDLRIFLLSLVALAAINRFPIVFEWKGESEHVNIEEALFVVLVLTSPPVAVMAAMVFSTLFLNVYSRLPLLKAAFNLGIFGVSVSAALQVARLVAGDVPTGGSWRGIAAAAAGALVMYVTTTLGVRAVVAVTDHLSFRSLFAYMNTMELVVVTSSVSIGVLAGLAGTRQPVALAFVFPPVAVVGFVLHRHARAVRARQDLHHLLATAVKATHAVGVPAVRDVLIDAACSLLHTNETRIQSAPPADGELGSVIQLDGAELWLVSQPRSAKDGDRGQSLLDGIAAIGSGAIGSAELLDRVRHQAFHDTLTGLPNRLLFADRATQALRSNSGLPAAILFLDLDRFKRINDSLGRQAGDESLVAVAERLQSALRACDTAARVEGDEFVVLLPDLANEDVALAVAWQVRDAMHVPFMVDGDEVVVTVSVGIAISSPGSTDYEPLMRAADRAMYEAKAEGRDTVHRSSAVRVLSGGLALENDLRHAIARQELWVAYQPQVDLRTHRIVGTEALVRWAHPVRGQMRPDEFLGLADDMGMLGDIDEWVLATACRQTALWRETVAPGLRVSVNLSAGPVRSPGLSDLVLTALGRAGLPAQALEIEVTERVVAVEDTTGIASLSRLRALGVRVAIDDFGTGYSSLSRLRSLPVDAVKIDQSFVREIAYRDRAMPLVTSTITMAHGLGLDVVAEGIETPTQLGFLTDSGCELGQGYLLGRPVPAAQVALGPVPWAAAR